MNQFFKLFATTVTISLISFSAFAGDLAKRHIHGFSVDGGLFAFEEYGVQDGSGFPYSNIYVIDTATDKWTVNSPYRVHLDDESKTIFDAREQARIMAGPVMKSFEDRGNVVATNRPTELGINKKRMVVNPRLVVPQIDTTIEFRLKKLNLSEPSNCQGLGMGRIVGFELLQIGTTNSSVTKRIHKDKKIPSSRNCPLDYDLADIVTYFPESGEPVAAILIFVQSVGFEGPDGRYLAITTKLQ